MNKKSAAKILAMLLALGTANVASAAPVTNLGYYNFLDTWGLNPLGVDPGQYGNIGGHFSPANGTSVTAQQGAFDVPLFSRASPALPYEFGRMEKLSTLQNLGIPLNGTWNLTARNGADTVSVETKRAYLTAPPMITNVQTNGLSTTPTLSWTRAAFVAPAEYNQGTALTVWDLSLQPGHQIVHRALLGVNANSYTLPAGKMGVGKNYVISVETTIRNKSDVSTNMPFGSLAAATRNFFNFQPQANAVQFSAPVNLPVEGNPGRFTFDMDVEEGVPYLIDPIIAVGYDFAIGAGNPLFASILFPDLGNFLYEIYLWNGSDWIFDDFVAALTRFDFDGGGVDRFRVLGIDPSLGLDPNDPTAFVTEVTFAGTGRFTGSMTAITAQVPEPSSVLLVGLGMLGLMFARKHQVV